MKYKVGDKVRIVSEKAGKHWAPNGDMDKYLGKVMTVRKVVESEFISYYRMWEDTNDYELGHCWHEHMIKGLLEEANEEFKPYVKTEFMFLNTFNGIIGSSTKMKDSYGNDLYIGDLVCVIDDAMMCSYCAVVIERDGIPFINGIHSSCGSDGTIDNYTVIKVVPQSPLKHGEKIGQIKFIMKED